MTVCGGGGEGGGHGRMDRCLVWGTLRWFRPPRVVLSVVQRRPVWLECVMCRPSTRDDVQSIQTDVSSSERGQVREGPRSEVGPGA